MCNELVNSTIHSSRKIRFRGCVTSRPLFRIQFLLVYRGALRAETEIDTKSIPRRFRASPHVRGTLVKPGDQILDPQVVVPYYPKNQKTDFLAIFGSFFWQFFPMGSTNIIVS